MSDSQEKSDDLIAELAKLMASNATGSEPAQKPTVIKLPPLNEATVQTAPVRIPGMEPAPKPAEPPPQSAATAPVRIPGMEKPPGVDLPPLPQAQPRPASQFDFGRPPQPAPVIKPEPITNWETRAVPNLKLADPVPRPAAVQQLAAMKFDPVTPASAVDAKPVTTSDAARPAAPPQKPAAPIPAAVVTPASVEPMPAPMSSKPNTAPAGDDFNFDFGLSGGGESSHDDADDGANDPIADIIASEIEGINNEPAPAAKPVPPPPLATVAPRASAMPAPVKPPGAAPQPAEPSRFASTPAFGKPAPMVPIPHIEVEDEDDEGDPMDEIEDLIGEAVRTEHAASEKAAHAPVSPPPVVPPLGSSFGPRRANIKEKDREEPSMGSAEAAILAAAAASGAEVGRVEGPQADERPYRRMKVKPPKTSLVSSGARPYVGIAVAGTLLLASGFGLYWVLGMGRDDPANAPVLTADADPAKVAPAVNAALTAEPSSPVFDEINGTTAVDGIETLVSRDETEGETVTEVARIVEPVVEDAATVAESGLANRRVRTVTVRPDGTIVSGEDAVAGTSLLPVDRPNVPEIAGVEPIETGLSGAEMETASTDPLADEADPLAALVAGNNSATTTTLGETDPLEVVAIDPLLATPPVFDASIVAPVPMPRPSSRDTLVGGTFSSAAQDIGVNTPASTPLVAIANETPAAAPVASSSGSGAYVQLSSQPNESAAQSTLRTTERQMAGMLNGASLEIRRVDLGAKGVWYRVVLPVRSFQDATQTCAAIKSNGGDCVAING